MFALIAVIVSITTALSFLADLAHADTAAYNRKSDILMHAAHCNLDFRRAAFNFSHMS